MLRDGQFRGFGSQMIDRKSPFEMAPAPSFGSRSSAPERRATKRVQLVASAEAIDLGTGTRLSGRVSDISLAGCYMDVMSPFGEGTNIGLRIKYNGQSVDLKGVVRFSHGSLGMGIGFSSLAPPQLETLGSWIGELTGERPKPVQMPKFEVMTEETREARSAERGEKSPLEQLVDLLVKKGILTNAEVSDLLSKL
jgi:hypothetical protein